MVNYQVPETIAQVKAHVPEALKSKSLWIGPLLFAISATLYISTFAVIMAPLPFWIRCLASAANAIFIATLFIVGHDACHGSLTPKPWLNKLLGRLSFLPSWHPFISWDLGHNRIHHSWTNLKGRDYVWTPLSPQEYRELSATGRFLQRFYRSLPGIGCYYFWEVWFKHMIFPRNADRKRMSPALLAADRSAVALFIGCQIAISVATSIHFQIPAWHSLLLAVVLPQILWNQLMGLVILLHHTHPKVRWFDDPEEWNFFNGQVRGTVHVKFPWPVGAILHHIMDHTAHHVDPRIPLYHLPDAQVVMEKNYPSDVIISPFSLGNLRKIIRDCQLYDYRQHQWLQFEHALSEAPQMTSALRGYMTVEDASAYARIPLSQMYRLIERGELEAAHRNGRWHVQRSHLDQAILAMNTSDDQLQILVVDDNTAIQALFKQFLTNSGCLYSGAFSGNEAVLATKSKKFDLVFLDLQMPDLSGDDAFAQLKSINPLLPIAIITGYPDSERLSRVLSHGPVMVIQKPLKQEELKLAISQLGRSSKFIGSQHPVQDSVLVR